MQQASKPTVSLIAGGVRSAKGRYPMPLAYGKIKVTFVAAGLATDGQMRSRSERHQSERPAGWPTVEEPLKLARVLRGLDNREVFARACADADVAIAEGVMGLFDRKSAPEETGSSAENAKLLTDAIAAKCKTPVVGWLPREPEAAIREHHLGLHATCSEDTGESIQRRRDALADFDEKKAGVLPLRFEMTPRLANLGYVSVTTLRDTLLGPAGQHVQGHSFHYSRLNSTAALPCAYQFDYSLSGRRQEEGYCVGNPLGTYVHLHFRTGPQVAEHFVAAAIDPRVHQEATR